jgi:pyruvate kinase
MRELVERQAATTAAAAIASVVEHALQTVPCAAVFVPTRTGATARMISRFKPDVWIAAVSSDPAVCQALTFSYGVHPSGIEAEPADWRTYAGAWLTEHEFSGDTALLVAGPSRAHPEASHRIELMRVGARPSR